MRTLVVVGKGAAEKACYESDARELHDEEEKKTCLMDKHGGVMGR